MFCFFRLLFCYNVAQEEETARSVKSVGIVVMKENSSCLLSKKSDSLKLLIFKECYEFQLDFICFCIFSYARVDIEDFDDKHILKKKYR